MTVAVAVESALGRIGPDERAVLEHYGARAIWPAGFTIYQRGTPADGVFIVLNGRIVLRSRVRAGRGFVPTIATADDTFGAEGLAPGGSYVTDAKADEESETLHLSGMRFREFLRERPQQAIALIGRVMAERNALLDKLRELTTLTRVAQKRTFSDEDGNIVLCSSRYRLLCELVGATRESVSLVLSRLTGEGVVQRRGANFVIENPALLAERIDAGLLDREPEIAAMSGVTSQTVS
jgi:CRP/FNR family cyclic AMP-dependent transcriptional regulator